MTRETAADALKSTVAVLGAGSWGTALAIQFARAGTPTVLWSRRSEQAQSMQAQRKNDEYLPGAKFPEALSVSADLREAVRGAWAVVVAVPSQAFRPLLDELRAQLGTDTIVGWATKGFEHPSGKLLDEVAREALGEQHPRAVLSGPTFAREVGAGLPTAMTIAATDARAAEALANAISNSVFRAYTSDDMTGVEVGGAVKNVLAIGAGLSDGLGYGANTRVAVITRGLVEMTRLGVALGARQETFMGLAGMGDLILTCTDDQSRNRRMGLALARGASVERAESEIRQVVEGVRAARAVHAVAQAAKVDMPICESLYRVLYEGLSPRDAVRMLMSRSLKREH
ncbi:MAG: NAD(P)H-dependent glycerol-3-phosphate dehydrogenase [Pseudomonadota bacterium]